MPLASITHSPKQAPGKPRGRGRATDRRFEALLMQSFVEMRARHASQ